MHLCRSQQGSAPTEQRSPGETQNVGRLEGAGVTGAGLGRGDGLDVGEAVGTGVGGGLGGKDGDDDGELVGCWCQKKKQEIREGSAREVCELANNRFMTKETLYRGNFPICTYP